MISTTEPGKDDAPSELTVFAFAFASVLAFTVQTFVAASTHSNARYRLPVLPKIELVRPSTRIRGRAVFPARWFSLISNWSPSLAEIAADVATQRPLWRAALLPLNSVRSEFRNGVVIARLENLLSLLRCAPYQTAFRVRHCACGSESFTKASTPSRNLIYMVPLLQLHCVRHKIKCGDWGAVWPRGAVVRQAV